MTYSVDVFDVKKATCQCNIRLPTQVYGSIRRSRLYVPLACIVYVCMGSVAYIRTDPGQVSRNLTVCIL